MSRGDAGAYVRMPGGSGSGSSGVTTFNTRSGAVTLSKADVTGTGLAAVDVGAIASGVAGVSAIESFAYKAADQFVNAVATIANDTDLHLSLVANAVYKFEAYLVYDGSTTADMDVKWNVPTGITGGWSGQLFGSGASTTNSVQDLGQHAWGSTVTLGAVGVATEVCVPMRGLIIVGSTAGTLQLEWAQHVSDATNLTVRTGSYLGLKRVA